MDTYVCGNCFDDYAVKEFIKRGAEVPKCDYCQQSSNTDSIATPLSEVGAFMLEGLETEWSHPEDEAVAWDSEDGRYVCVVLDSYDLVERYLTLDSDQLRDDLADQLGDRDWCQKNPYRLTTEEAWSFDWGSFSEQLKHETRYVFFRVERERDDFSEGGQNPYQIMDEIAAIVSEQELIRKIPAGSTIIRARPHRAHEHFESVVDLGPPPKKCAVNANRMSPSGIVMFYGSDTEATAISEIEQTGFATIANFRTLKEFKVLDLTRIPDIPSIFDATSNYQRPPLIFLHDFLADFTKKVVKDGREHIEYVPTQVITEYFRRVFRDGEGDELKGIIYPSPRTESGISWVLFFDNDDCIQDDLSIKDDKWLCMETASVKRIGFVVAEPQG
jgi:hypothetical protein